MAVAGCGASSNDTPAIDETTIEATSIPPSTAPVDPAEDTAEESAQDPAEESAQDPAEESARETAEDSSGPFDWQGHRGARGLRPENTLPAFELALDLGVDTLEFDLHLAADDVVVVWHDPTIESGKCGEGAESRPVRELTSTELGALRCDRNPDPGRFPDQIAEPGAISGDDYSIPTLSEVFDFVAGYAESAAKTPEQRANAGTVRFNIETKRDPGAPEKIGDGFDGENPGPFEQAIIDAADRAGVIERVTVQSFDHRSLFAIHRSRPEVDLAALTRRGEIPDFDDLVEQGIAIWSPDYRSLDGPAIDAAHQAGLTVVPWTVNDPADMKQLIVDGVDGLITDRPDLRPDGS